MLLSADGNPLILTLETQAPHQVQIRVTVKTSKLAESLRKV
jgi:hypothetical protein